MRGKLATYYLTNTYTIEENSNLQKLTKSGINKVYSKECTLFIRQIN